jgi:hypothetical protein
MAMLNLLVLMMKGFTMERQLNVKLWRGEKRGALAVSDKVITKIAKEVLGIKTFVSQGYSSADFHDVPCWSVEKALRLAYEAGRESSLKSVRGNTKENA